MGIIKTAEEIVKMRAAGAFAGEILERIVPFVVPGVSTQRLDELCHQWIVEAGAVPAPLHYRGYPKSICTSVNHVVCHGIPSSEVILKQGDIVNLDITVIVDGYHGDTSRMFELGKVAPYLHTLCEVTQEALYRAIEVVRPGAHLGDIGHCIQSIARKHGYGVVREYTGHGIGKGFHEEPYVLHYGEKGKGPELKAGMCFTIEPMLNLGSAEVRVLSDGWTVVTRDRKASAQWEHTVLVTPEGVEILTLRDSERVSRVYPPQT